MVDVVLIGTGYMGTEYAKILQYLNKKFIVIGRGKTSAHNFFLKTGIKPITGGINKWIKNNENICNKVIIAVTGTELGKVTRTLLQNNFDNILVEKPGATTFNDLKKTKKLSEETSANIYIGYNRRFYNSVIKAKEIIFEDGGLKSFNFEFTEWSHVIDKNKHDNIILQNWFLHNSTHVVDLAFFLGGEPTEMCCYVKDFSNWHKKGMVFTGSGTTTNDSLFSYHANWSSPGNWGLELLTKRYRIKLNPLEKIFIKKIGDKKYTELEIEEEKFKPGLLNQVYSWINNKNTNFLTIDKQFNRLKWYKKMLKRA